MVTEPEDVTEPFEVHCPFSQIHDPAEGAGVEQPWKVDGALGLATIMAATASFDHRAIDGAVAARFMAALRERIEEPLSLCC